MLWRWRRISVIALRRIQICILICWTWKLLKLIKIVDPLVQDPFRSFEDRTSTVGGPQVPMALPIEVVPQCHGPAWGHDHLKISPSCINQSIISEVNWRHMSILVIQNIFHKIVITLEIICQKESLLRSGVRWPPVGLGQGMLKQLL